MQAVLKKMREDNFPIGYLLWPALAGAKGLQVSDIYPLVEKSADRICSSFVRSTRKSFGLASKNRAPSSLVNSLSWTTFDVLKMPIGILLNPFSFLI